jgi:sugar phosphate permease
MLTDPAQIAAKYSRWQLRVLIFSIVGYATFYFVRKNLGIAMPLMSQELGITKEKLGLFLTLHGVLYGVSKFANGFLADRANARAFMAVSLAISALLNIFFGFSSGVLAFGPSGWRTAGFKAWVFRRARGSSPTGFHRNNSPPNSPSGTRRTTSAASSSFCSADFL